MNFSIHAMAATLLAALWKGGGGTIDPRTGELAKFRTGFLVSHRKYEKRFLHWPNVNEIADWLSDVAPGWHRSANPLYPGIWYDRQALTIFLDLNEFIVDELSALELGNRERQTSIRCNSRAKNIFFLPERKAA
jgi:hypothetical protein